MLLQTTIIKNKKYPETKNSSLPLPVHYFLDTEFIPATGLLCEEESHHATRALRLGVNDHILVGNGRGQIFECTIADQGKKNLLLTTLTESDIPAAHPAISIAIAPLKNASRLEWFVEKATEMGADTIIPLLTHRTERPKLNAERMHRLIRSATKQSNRAWMPQLDLPTNFNDLIIDTKGLKIIAHCDSNFSRKPLRQCLPSKPPESATILIGPEGDFTPAEIKSGYEAGFEGCELGPNRLRTETAGIFCVSLLTGIYR